MYMLNHGPLLFLTSSLPFRIGVLSLATLVRENCQSLKCALYTSITSLSQPWTVTHHRSEKEVKADLVAL
jgi:hypothetical protein